MVEDCLSKPTPMFYICNFFTRPGFLYHVVDTLILTEDRISKVSLLIKSRQSVTCYRSFPIFSVLLQRDQDWIDGVLYVFILNTQFYVTLQLIEVCRLLRYVRLHFVFCVLNFVPKVSVDRGARIGLRRRIIVTVDSYYRCKNSEFKRCRFYTQD